jgi:hypothetical protein
MFEAQMPSVILESVAVMKSPTMLLVSTYYPAEIAWVDESTPTKGIDEDWGEGRFLIEHHSMRCITTFNGELYALAVNNLEFGTLVCTNNIQLEQGASTVNMETLFSFPELGNNKFYLVKSDGDLLLVLLGGRLEEGQILVYHVYTESRSLHAVSNIGSLPSSSIISGVSLSIPECTRHFDLAASTTRIWVISESTLMI